MRNHKLPGGVLLEDGRMEGPVLVGAEGVVGEEVVAVADVRAAQLDAGGGEGEDVALRGGDVDGELHAVLLGQVEVHLLLVADDDRDVVDPDLLELADLALDEGLALLHVQALRKGVDRLRGDVASARRHDDGVSHPAGLDVGQAGLGDLPVGQVALRLERGQGGLVFAAVLEDVVRDRIAALSRQDELDCLQLSKRDHGSSVANLRDIGSRRFRVAKNYRGNVPD